MMEKSCCSESFSIKKNYVEGIQVDPEALEEFSLASVQYQTALQALDITVPPSSTSYEVAKAYFDVCLDRVVEGKFVVELFWNKILSQYPELTTSVNIDIVSGRLYYEE